MCGYKYVNDFSVGYLNMSIHAYSTDAYLLTQYTQYKCVYLEAIWTQRTSRRHHTSVQMCDAQHKSSRHARILVLGIRRGLLQVLH